VKLAHPLKTRAIAETKIKTDKINAEKQITINAETIAHALRIYLLPEKLCSR